MFDWIPEPIAAILGISLLIFLGVQGIRVTTRKDDSKSKNTSSSTNENKEK